MDINENDYEYDSSNHAADDEDEVSIPVARLFPALRAYFTACTDDDVPDENIVSMCQDFEHRVESLAQALFGAFGVAFEYEHLLETTTTAVSTSAMKKSAVEEDPRLRHPLCPPS
jgi:hypothetical protein